MPNLPIRYKSVLHSSEISSPQPKTYYYHEKEPIREWNIVPWQSDIHWRKGSALPSDRLLTVQYAEIDLWEGKDSAGEDSYRSLGFTDFRFVFEKAEGYLFFEVSWVRNTQDQRQHDIQEYVGCLRKYHSDPYKAFPLRFKLHFRDFEYLSQDSVPLKVRFSIYAKNPNGYEKKLESKDHITMIHVEGLTKTKPKIQTLGDSSLLIYELPRKVLYGNLILKILHNDRHEPLSAVFEDKDKDGALTVTPNHEFSAFEISKGPRIEQIYTEPATRTYPLQIRKTVGDTLLFTHELVLSVQYDEYAEQRKKSEEPLLIKTISEDYNFCLDRAVKIIVKQSNPASDRVKMSLCMCFEDYDKQAYTVEQDYDFMFFQGKIELYPGEEIQDFFDELPSFDWTLSDFTQGKVLKPQNGIKMARVTIQLLEKDAQEKTYASYKMEDTRWIPGKKPAAFPYLTQSPLRRTYTDSLIVINSLQELYVKKALGKIASNLTDYSMITKEDYLVCAFFRRSFADKSYGAARTLKNEGMALEPIPNPRHTIDVIFQNQNYCPDWFTFSGEWQRQSALTHTLSHDFKRGERKAAVEEKITVKLNTGWIFAEEIELLNELIQAPLCFAFLQNRWRRLIPIEKKPLSYESERNLHQQLVSFKLIKDDEG